MSKKGDKALTPQIAFTGTKATITAWAGAVVGMEAIATDTAEKGAHDGAIWQWSPIAGGGSAAWGAISGTLSSQTDLQTVLDSKVDENIGIAGATKTKITYDAKGLVTSGADATTADVADSTNKRYVTDANLTVIGDTSGVNTGDNATNATSNTYADGKVADAITDGVTNVAPSQNVVFDALALKQPLDSDLTAIAALSPANDDIIQRKAGVWTNRTMEQVANDMVVRIATGAISAFAGASAPTGYLLCNGAAVSRTTYAGLFAVCSTTYGVGDGSATFNVPNLKGRVIAGYDSAQMEFDAVGETGGAKKHTLATSEMPAHNHTGDPHNHTQNPHKHRAGWVYGGGVASWRFENGAIDGGAGADTNDTTATNNETTAANRNTGGNGEHNNLQPYMALNYIIKT